MAFTLARRSTLTAHRCFAEKRIPKSIKDLQTKLDRSEKDIAEGKVYTQSEVESHFKNRMR